MGIPPIDSNNYLKAGAAAQAYTPSNFTPRPLGKNNVWQIPAQGQVTGGNQPVTYDALKAIASLGKQPTPNYGNQEYSFQQGATPLYSLAGFNGERIDSNNSWLA
jgi:hypothetical protein